MSPRPKSPARPNRRKHTFMETRRTHYRWVICALLFFATTINYVDRQVFGILGPKVDRGVRLVGKRLQLHRQRFHAGLRHRLRCWPGG